MTARDDLIHHLGYVVGTLTAVLDDPLRSDAQKVERARAVLAAHHAWVVDTNETLRDAHERRRAR